MKFIQKSVKQKKNHRLLVLKRIVSYLFNFSLQSFVSYWSIPCIIAATVVECSKVRDIMVRQFNNLLCICFVFLRNWSRLFDVVNLALIFLLCRNYWKEVQKENHAHYWITLIFFQKKATKHFEGIFSIVERSAVKNLFSTYVLFCL